VRIGLIGPLPPELGGTTPGGVATHQAYLAAGLARVPDVNVALLATNVRSRSPTAAEACTDEYRLTRLYVPEWAGDWLAPGYLRRVRPTRVARYANDLARGRMRGSRREVLAHLLWYQHFLAATRPDVVHVQHPLERLRYVRDVARLERTRWPLVVTAHSFFGEHTDDVIHRFMAPNLHAADRVIAVSPHIADQAVSLGVDHARVRVIRSGIDVDRFRPGDRAAARSFLSVAPDRPTVLFVGNLEPRKQVDVLLRGLAQVPGADLAIIGTGHSAGADDQTAPLHALVADLGLGERVRFEGRVDGATLMRWYAAADVFALASSSEAQGIVALEAMACGLPVVASAVGGLVGTVEDGRTGYLVPSGHVEPLARRLGDLLSDAQRRQAMGDAARAHVVREFTWQRAVDATLEVYREVLACPAR
jgi:glycosyltransferase involved in cell wall biosynthesis